MNTNPNIELCLNVRSYEKVVLLAEDGGHTYPERWQRPGSETELHDAINADSVVLIDRIDVARKSLVTVASKGPRLVAFAPSNVEQEKIMRKTIRTMFPWAEVWEIQSSLGKLLVSNGINGKPYDRDNVRDDRQTGVVA